MWLRVQALESDSPGLKPLPLSLSTCETHLFPETSEISGNNYDVSNPLSGSL